MKNNINQEKSLMENCQQNQYENIEKTTTWDIRIENLVAGYTPEIDIIKSMNAQMPAGKITAVLGGSGCGKTTLLRIILGLNKAKSGKIFIGKKDIFNLTNSQFRAMRRRIGVLFQDGALLSSLTLEENVGLPLKEHTKLSASLIKEAVHNVLALVGLADSAHKYPSELSGGMKKRAGLARAIITEPPLLFYDEPTSGLDPITSARMDTLLMDMQAWYKNMTTILITHDLMSVRRAADYILLLKDGTAYFNGTRDEFFSSSDEYIIDFIGQNLNIESKVQLAPVNREVREALDAWLMS